MNCQDPKSEWGLNRWDPTPLQISTWDGNKMKLYNRTYINGERKYVPVAIGVGTEVVEENGKFRTAVQWNPQKADEDYVNLIMENNKLSKIAQGLALLVLIVGIVGLVGWVS